MKEGYCVDLRIFLTVEPLLAVYKIPILYAVSRRSLAGRTPWLKRKDVGKLSAVSPSKGCGSTERRFGQRTQPGTYGEGHYFRGQPATGNENL